MVQRQLRNGVAVTQALNFTRAAEKLHTSQPSLSSQIRDLEN
ncbi:LysR family transcriptional regulator, partial [Escherichia coli]